MTYPIWTKFTERVSIVSSVVERLDLITGLPITVAPIPSGTFTKPSAANTGLLTAEGSLVVYTGPSTIDETYPGYDAGGVGTGVVIEGFHFQNQGIKIKAENVTVRDSLISAPKSIDTEDTYPYGIQCTYGFTGTLIENCEFRGWHSSNFYGGDCTVRKCHLWESGGDGTKFTNNFIFEMNWINLLGYEASAHADGIQMVSGGNGIVRGNFFDMIPGIIVDGQQYKNSQCIIISTNNGPIDNVDIYENWFNGGIQSVLIGDKGVGYGLPTNMKIRNNVYTRDSWQVNPWSMEGVDTFGNEIYGNVYEDNGQLMPNQGVAP